MVDFGDYNEVEAWLNTRSREEIAVFAARAAARVFPVLEHEPDWSKSNIDLICARAILTAGVRGVYATPAVRAAAAAAASFAASFADPDASFFAADPAASFAASFAAADAAASFAAAARAAAAASFAAADAAASFADASFAAAAADAASFDEVAAERVMGQALWQGGAPDVIAQDWQAMRAVRNVDHRIWGFWIDWYDGLLEGRSIDWELWYDVAVIPNAIWEEGPEAVAKAIVSIKRRRMVRVAPALVLDADMRVFHVGGPNDVPDDVFGYVKDRVRMALGNALSSGASNGFSETSYEAVAVQSALDDPQVRADVLAGAFYDAALGFVANIGDVYPDDVALVNFKNVLYAASEEICEHDEDARKRCLRLAKLTLARDVTPVEADDLDEMVAVVAENDVADAEVMAILDKDAGTIATLQKAPRWVKARFMSYMTTISDHLDRLKKADGRVSWLVRRLDDLWDWFKSEDD